MQDKEVMRLRARLHSAGFKDVSITRSAQRGVYLVIASYQGYPFTKLIPYSELRFHPVKNVYYIL